MTRFLFDIDGTLTEARQRINTQFAEFMADFARSNNVAFVTGNDRDRTLEQLGEELLRLAEYSFNCAGNEVWYKGRLIQKHVWQLPSELSILLEELLAESRFNRAPRRYTKHISHRTGMINFSIPGHNSTGEYRKSYIEWDKSTSERKRFRDKISNKFPDIEVLIAGDTGIDLYPMGNGKEQVIDFLNGVEDAKTYFFGDQIMPGGNDYKIAKRADHSYRVKSWRDTYETLSFFKETSICE